MSDDGLDDLELTELRKEKLRSEIQVNEKEVERREIQLSYERGECLPVAEACQTVDAFFAELKKFGSLIQREADHLLDRWNENLVRIGEEIKNGSMKITSSKPGKSD